MHVHYRNCSSLKIDCKKFLCEVPYLLCLSDFFQMKCTQFGSKRLVLSFYLAALWALRLGFPLALQQHQQGWLHLLLTPASSVGQMQCGKQLPRFGLPSSALALEGLVKKDQLLFSFCCSYPHTCAWGMGLLYKQAAGVFTWPYPEKQSCFQPGKQICLGPPQLPNTKRSLTRSCSGFWCKIDVPA